MRRRVSTSGASFVNDFPLAVFTQPVLALLHLVVQIVAVVILVKGHDDDFFLARIAENGQVVDLQLDPFLAGFCLEIPEGYFVEIRPRSGLSSKENILIPNSPGTVDSDYRGQVFVPLLNLSKAPFTVTNGLRIAQMLVCRSIEMEWNLVEEISLDTARGIGGFGSTGKV